MTGKNSSGKSHWMKKQLKLKEGSRRRQYSSWRRTFLCSILGGWRFWSWPETVTAAMLALVWAQCTNTMQLTSQQPSHALSFTSWCLVPWYVHSIHAALPPSNNLSPLSLPLALLLLLLMPQGFFLSSAWVHGVSYITAFWQSRMLQDPRTPAFVLQTVFKANLLWWSRHCKDPIAWEPLFRTW